MNFAKRDLRISALFLFSILLFVVTFGLLWKHPFLNFDDFALVDPLKNVQSLADYTNALRTNLIMDITPVRDFTYWLELQVESYTGFINHQFVNVLFWIAAIWIFSLVLVELRVRKEIIAGAVLLVGLHPLIHSSVFWIAGRKHLLSAFFLLTATLFFFRALKKNQNSLFVVSWICLFLSCFSQPIGIGFPIFVAAFLYADRKYSLKTAIYFVACTLLSATVAILNLRYYSSDSYANTGGLLVPKFQGESLDLIMKRFLVWGRDVFQILFPVRPSITAYNLESITSIIGLVLICAVIAGLFIERKHFRRLFPWLVYLSLPISVVTFKLTGQGGFDTYLLSPLLGAGVALSVWAESRNFQLSKVAVGIASAILVLFLVIDAKMANAWSDPNELWATAVETENSKTARSMYLRTRLSDPMFDPAEALKLANEMKQDDPSNPALGYNLGKAIDVQKISLDEKHKLFEQNKVEDAWYDYFWCANDARQGLFERATSRLFDRFNADPRRFMIAMAYSLDDVQSKWTKMCELAKRADCAQITKLIDTEKKRIESANR